MSVSRTSYTMRVISRSCSIKTGSSPIRWHAAQPLRSQPQPLLAYLQHSHYSSSSSPTSSSTSSIPRPLTNRTSAPLAATEQDPNFSHLPKIRPPKPEYQITFTCDPCGTRSSHKISKQGYHKGSVLISCPECKNRHVISDHLGVSCGVSLFRTLLFVVYGALGRKCTGGR